MSPNPASKRHWPKVLLITSLALNLLLVGYLFGSDQRLRGERAMGPPHSQIGHFLRRQNDDRKAALAPLARSYWRESRRSLQKLRSARRALNTALANEPLDAEQIEQAMTGVDQALLLSSQTSQRAMLPLIAALTPAEREQLARSGRHQRGYSPGNARAKGRGDGRGYGKEQPAAEAPAQQP